MPKLTEYQQYLLDAIECEKANPSHDSKALGRLVKMLSATDDLSKELYKESKRRYGRPGSRSPSFGKWSRDDESFY